MLRGDALRDMCALTYYLVHLSSELFIAPESGKIIIRTDSCLLFKRQTTERILSGVTMKLVRSQGDSAKRILLSCHLDNSEAQPAVD